MSPLPVPVISSYPLKKTAIVAMQAAMHSDKPLADFHQSRPKMGKVKLLDFAVEFALKYNQK